MILATAFGDYYTSKDTMYSSLPQEVSMKRQSYQKVGIG